MSPLLLALAVLGPSPAGEGWWNPEWKFRRPIAVNNRLDRPLEKDFTMQVEIDPEYLGIRDRCRADWGDWALVYHGVRIPCLLQPGRGKGLLMNFRIREDIKAGSIDSYLLYYGNPGAAPVKVSPEEVFEFFEDFSRPESLA
jgi:hypothetical protein